jgi:radical SAM superfamily enzyme YgiQ (UPF0313 family)
MRSRRLKIGVLDLLSGEWNGGAAAHPYGLIYRRMFYGVMPQVVAAWCRRRGHEVYYATYFGQRRPERLMPNGLDLVFISAFTEAAALAYALAVLFRQKGVRTVLGGPHARSFPNDASRFFDTVVVSCDAAAIEDILCGEYAPRAVVRAPGKVVDIPSLEERHADIDRATLIAGRHWGISLVPLLASTGCPYACDFCVDWNNPYFARSQDEIQGDLGYASRAMPGRLLAFHDPNFGVRFDQTLEAFGGIAPEHRNPYLIETTLSILKKDRLGRLAETNCVFVAPGVESWTDYGAKAGTGQRTRRAKLEHVLAQFDAIAAHIPEVQANFMFGNEADEGEEPIELTSEFLRLRPRICPVISYPLAYGGTLLRDTLRGEGRLLPLPSIYYFTPLPSFRVKHYAPAAFYAGLITLLQASIAPRIVASRIAASGGVAMRLMHLLRAFAIAAYVRELRAFFSVLRTDPSVARFADGSSAILPAHFDRLLEGRLGRYAALLDSSARYHLGPE